MTDFLFRMVQRAAGWPTAAATPRPPSQFYWPAPADTAASRAVLQGVNPDASSRAGTRAIGAARVLGSAAESPAPKPGLAAMTPPDQSAVNFPRTIETESSTSVPAADESIESHAIFDRSHETTLADRQTPAGIKPRTPTRPAEGTRSALFNRENPAPAEPQPFATDSDDVPASRTAQRPSESADLAAQEQPRRPLVSGDAAHAMNETRDETRPVSIRSDTPARLTPAARQALPRISRGQSRMQETQPPVEVKIASVQIIFDRPRVQATPPAPVRPAGFAEFAELRNYAARPWFARGR